MLVGVLARPESRNSRRSRNRHKRSRWRSSFSLARCQSDGEINGGVNPSRVALWPALLADSAPAENAPVEPQKVATYSGNSSSEAEAA